MNQAELRQLAEARILDAEALLNTGRWSFGYYVAGYAVECALKSCLLSRMVHTGWVFKEKVKIDECLTHDFGNLLHIAGLHDLWIVKMRDSAAAGGEFADNWKTVEEWDVTSRYETKSEAEARTLLAAITDDPHGVLRWIKLYW